VFKLCTKFEDIEQSTAVLLTI